ncbi:beta-lactamase-like protein [Amylostereum chailletii]|nr:beta-lactamase-like protein [Amylostereum chailletii]
MAAVSQAYPFARVAKLSITFLVDNSIEWFTKLPPGFTHEIHQHLRGPNPPPIDPLTGAPILDLENYCCGAHGLSALIETEDASGVPHFTLFDTGPDSRSLPRNLAALAIDSHAISRVVLSHWHADHTGGLLAFLRLRSASPCVVDAHPSRPIARGIAPPPGNKVSARLPADPTFEQMEQAGAVVERHDEGHAVAGGTVWVSGEIERTTSWEEGLLGGMRWVVAPGEKEENGSWTPEPDIMDERYAVVDVLGKGLVIFTACSHAGVVNVAKDATKTFNRPIYMIIGGLHLAAPDHANRIEPTVKFLAHSLRPAPTYILPMHCTGLPAKCALVNELGEGCVPAGVGIKVVVGGNEADDDRLWGSIVDS